MAQLLAIHRAACRHNQTQSSPQAPSIKSLQGRIRNRSTWPHHMTCSDLTAWYKCS